MSKIYHYLRLIILIIVLSLGILIFLKNFNNPYQHFSKESQSFIQGKLDISPIDFANNEDFVIKNGKYYWPEGPFPAVILVPFQIVFGSGFNQSYMQSLLVILIFTLLSKLAQLKGFNKEDVFYLILVFIFGSPAIGLLTNSATSQFAQVVAITLLTALLVELETKKRPLILGILEGALLATRPTAGFIFPAILYVIFKKDKQILLNIVYFLIPVISIIVLLLVFNQLRFDNPFDNGYFTNNINPYIKPLRNVGLFSIAHIPSNIFYYFLIPLQPITYGANHLIFPYFTYSTWGLSFFIVAPFFLYALASLSFKDTYLKFLWLTVAVTLFVLLSYFAPGWVQYGPRYTADFLPIIYLLTLYGLKSHRLNEPQKNIIVLSLILNIYLFIGYAGSFRVWSP